MFYVLGCVVCSAESVGRSVSVGGIGAVSSSCCSSYIPYSLQLGTVHTVHKSIILSIFVRFPVSLLLVLLLCCSELDPLEKVQRTTLISVIELAARSTVVIMTIYNDSMWELNQ